MKTLTLPTVHMNGTGARSLTEQYLQAANAVTLAIQDCQQSAPNGRDYYVQDGETLPIAGEEHWDRIQRLESVREELNVLALHCSQFIKP